MKTAKALEYSLSAGLPGRKQTLRLAPACLEYDNDSSSTGFFIRVPKEDILDIKYAMDWMLWYRFYVGCDFRIDIKTKQDGIVRIRFKSYFRRQTRRYYKAYAGIIDALWEYYLNDIANACLEKFYATYELELNGVKLTEQGVYFSDKAQGINWEELEVKDYPGYFAIYKASQPEQNKRLDFDEWGSQLLFSVLDTIRQKGPQKHQPG